MPISEIELNQDHHESFFRHLEQYLQDLKEEEVNVSLTNFSSSRLGPVLASSSFESSSENINGSTFGMIQEVNNNDHHLISQKTFPLSRNECLPSLNDSSQSDSTQMGFNGSSQKTSSSSSNALIFNGLKFLLICGKNLSKHQANIHVNNISKRGGFVEIFNNQTLSGEVDYVICGSEKFEKVKQLMPRYKNVVSPTFIIDCLHAQKLISNIKKYSIQIPEQTSKESFSQLYSINTPSTSQETTCLYPSHENKEKDNPSQFENKEKDKQERKNRFLNSFVCVNSNISSSSSNSCVNQELADMFDKLYKHYNSMNEPFRAMAYRKATTILRGISFKITSIDQIADIPGIGDKVREKIKEYLQFGKISRLESVQTNNVNTVIQSFTKIWGVGTKTAEILYSQGCRKIEDIDTSILNHQQLIGLKYYYEFQKRIPREEVKRISKIVQNIARKISSNIICEAVGSFRRGKPDCGDVDILISVRNGADDVYSSSADSSDSVSNIENFSLDGLLQKIVSKLQDMKIITDTLSMSCKLHLEEDENDTFMGVYCFEDVGIHRRIDIKVYRREHYAFALLYFTGSDHFNRSIRLLCRKKGYSLSDKSLCANTIRDKKSNRIHDGVKIPCATEREIFEKIGIPYKEPHERDV
ncbi:hypothetical protein FDP41_009297 [Naegleria fowleri]|uniref:DNA polymerase n=1 Tax=Naegleria fowleri TaxID=5763 RepID=A0A6A5BE91_NAEFO|nr:uncharacterized protein FDP41_009297 [Naegleria fowleri]KAF0972394.1 hypothetical protein FDP41_009297 [Naegleria fowleri]